ncbi:MAG: hypothetical protein KAQ78_09170 [Candidatus Latescibacteria bacterium]|nr:hypothetical protein [Candidatus Latescibacterota bacterium]
MVKRAVLIMIALLEISSVTWAEEVIVGRYPMGKYQLFYVAFGESYNERFPDLIRGTGRFFLLDAADSLLSEVETISQRAKVSIEIKDYGFALRSRQIEIRDIDQNCRGNTGPEVLIRLHGPSEDPGLIILGFDQEGVFRKLFDQDGERLEINAVAPNRLEIILNIRAGLAGTMFHRQSFLWDTETKQTYKVPHVFVNKSEYFLSYDIGKWPIWCIKSVPVYFDARSAVRREPMALIGKLGEGWQVSLDKFYRVEGEGAVSVRSDSLSGWLSQEDVNWDNFKLPAAD